MGRADGNVGFSPPRDRADAWEMRQRWCEAIGIDAARLVTVGQVHGAAVVQVSRDAAGRGARPGSHPAGSGDALITDAVDVPLLTLHADCMPLLLVDPDRPAVATVHAGWRGTVADVAGETVRALTRAYGSRPGRLLAYLGPAIGVCCYEVGADVVAGWTAQAGAAAEAALRRRDGRTTFDLRAANTILLERAGVGREQIEAGGGCTRCEGERWFSHRGQGGATGRFGAIIALTGELE